MPFNWGCASCHTSTLRRELVVPVAVFGLDLTIAAVNQQLRALILGNFTRPVDGVRLEVEELRGALGAAALDSPPVFARDHVLIAFCHIDHLCHSGIAAQIYVRQSIEMRTK
jgi:hypothetical protein